MNLKPVAVNYPSQDIFDGVKNVGSKSRETFPLRVLFEYTTIFSNTYVYIYRYTALHKTYIKLYKFRNINIEYFNLATVLIMKKHCSGTPVFLSTLSGCDILYNFSTSC
jgi:hypothetical protein